jgi:long-chain acyl-CoA synthetase
VTAGRRWQSPRSARPGTLPSITALLEPALARRPAAPAVIARGGTLSYAELDAAADAAAGALWELGVRPGDRVAACLPNDLQIVTAFHGAQRIGAVWAGIGEALTPAEQQGLAALCEPAVVLAGPRCALDGAAVTAGGAVVDTSRWAALTAARLAAPAAGAGPHAPAAIAFSSGTTGTPKAIVHSQHNLVLPAAVLVATRGWGPGLRKGDCFPFTILNLHVLSTLATAQAGGCSIVMDRRDPAGIAEWIQRCGITTWNGAPAQLLDLARREDLRLGPVTEVWTGGGDCPGYIRDAFGASKGIAVTATYGLSEAPTVVAVDPADGTHRPGASGRVLPHLDVAAYGDDGQRLEPGGTGELRIGAATAGRWAGCWRPPLGYWEGGVLRSAADTGAAEDTVVAAGTVATGDIGRVDAGGWLTVVDRKKLMIVRGGANVSPAEVEGVLAEHPGISAAVVFGIPDDRLGERVAALVVPADTSLDAAALVSFCSGRLARYKIPDVWGRAAALPRNAMNKIVRSGLPALLRSAPPL